MRILNLEFQQHQPKKDTQISLVNILLEWKEIYSLPFKVALDTKSREFSM